LEEQNPPNAPPYRNKKMIGVLVFDGSTSNHENKYQNTKKNVSGELRAKNSYECYPTEFASLTQNPKNIIGT
jgi:hypothetical protein